MGEDLLRLVYSKEGKSKVNNDISFILHYAGGVMTGPARFGRFSLLVLLLLSVFYFLVGKASFISMVASIPAKLYNVTNYETTGE